jgi:hypothetical protein
MFFFDSPILVHSPADFFAASHSAGHHFGPFGNDSAETMNDDPFVSFWNHFFPALG